MHGVILKDASLLIRWIPFVDEDLHSEPPDRGIGPVIARVMANNAVEGSKAKLQTT